MLVAFSFDTELAWGGLSPEKSQALFEDPSNGHEPIRFLLDQFEKFGLPATWGIVGKLLVEESQYGTISVPAHLQGANPETYSQADPLYFMPELLDWIENTEVDHEVAGHSFTHPRFGDLSKEQARSELTAMCEAFEAHGYDLDSMIHPYIDVEHLDLLSEFRISAYSLGVKTKAQTLVSGMYPFLTNDREFWSVPAVKPFIDSEDLVAIPRSRQLSDERWGWLNVRRLQNALDSGGDDLIHMTLHPHNLLYDPFLKSTIPRLLALIARKRDAGEVDVVTFSDIAAHLR